MLATLVPTAFFAALDRGDTSSRSGLPPPFVPLVSDFVRRDILRMSRGISVILLVMFVTFTCLYSVSLILLPQLCDISYLSTCIHSHCPSPGYEQPAEYGHNHAGLEPGIYPF